MGAVDCERQALNVFRMKMLGAEVVSVKAGQQTLKEAINEAMRDWVTNVRNTHYILGTAYGAHPYPMMVRNFQRVIGDEARGRFWRRKSGCPTCWSPASAAARTPSDCSIRSSRTRAVRMVGVEAGGEGIKPGAGTRRGSRAARSACCRARARYLLQDEYGQIQLTHSVSAGLDYAAVGPEHAWLRDQKRVEYTYATDDEALEAFIKLARLEGIIPALESAHAIAEVIAARAEDGQGPAHHRESLRPRRQGRGAGGGQVEAGDAGVTSAP